jgi:predicted DNA-binding WGR domain protein
LQFEKAGSFNGGLAPVQIAGKWGFINKTGKIIIETSFEDAGDFSENAAAVKINKKWGFIDKRGGIIIPPQFAEVSRFSQGLARARTGNKWGFINKSGSYEIDPQFDNAADFSEGYAAVTQKGLWGYVDKNLFKEESPLGLFVGTVKEVSGTTIIVSGSGIDQKVQMGNILIVDTGNVRIEIKAVFPMMTQAKCTIGKKNEKIKPGMKVYKTAE